MATGKIVDKSGKNVEAMFDSIASKYDFLNHFLSLGIDRMWRKRLIRAIARSKPARILDVATGTADLPILLAKRLPSASIIGVDISEKMLGVGRLKVSHCGLDSRITLRRASALALPFPDASFDGAMVAFGVRNFEDLTRGLSEIARVVQPGSMLAILEFSLPTRFPMAQLYRFYFRILLPLLGGLVSGNRKAYTYLPYSVYSFPERKEFVALLESLNFCRCRAKSLTFGVATLYTAIKC